MCKPCPSDDLSPARNFLVGLAVAALMWVIALAVAWWVST